MRETLKDVSNRVKKFKSERIALIISGTYQYTQIFQHQSNKMGTENFRFIFIGTLKKNSTFKAKVPEHEPKLPSFDNYVITMDKLFKSELPVIEKLKEVTDKPKRIALQHYAREAPEWNIKDLIATSMDVETWKRLFPFKLETKKVQLFIGNEEFEKFLSTRKEHEIEIIKQLDIW